jgi:hypothetical protein
MERLSNAIDLLGEAARRPFDQNDKRRAMELLREADGAGPLVEPVRRLVGQLDALPAGEPPRLARWAGAVRRRYVEVVERPWFARLLAAVFVLWAALSFFAVADLALSFAFDWGGAMSGYRSDELSDVTFVNWASLVSSALSAVLVAAGLVRLGRGRRVAAYRMFTYALLVAIFVTRVFAFVESQFGAVFGLAVDLVLLVTVHYMTEQERRRERARRLVSAQPALARLSSPTAAARPRRRCL